MEGGYLPWRRQQVEAIKHWDPVEAQKTLPPPPPGLVWVRGRDGMFELEEEPRAESGEGEPAFETRRREEEFVEHVVVPSDTLAGLRLRYGVSATELRRCNGFEGENFRVRSVLKIPVAKSRRDRERFPSQRATREVVVQRFRNATGLGATEAGIYLEAAKWDLDAALRAARADDDFEATRLAEVNARLAPLASSAVVVHLESATNLRDAGFLGPMDVYVVAALWDSQDLVAEARSCAVKGNGGTWRWSPTQAHASLLLPLPEHCASNDLALSLSVFAPNDLMTDTPVGATKTLPLKRLVDAAIHAVGVDTGGELRISILAPDNIKRDAVRAVALERTDDNPFIQPLPATAAPPSVPLVTAVAVRVDETSDPLPSPPGAVVLV